MSTTLKYGMLPCNCTKKLLRIEKGYINKIYLKVTKRSSYKKLKSKYLWLKNTSIRTSLFASHKACVINFKNNLTKQLEFGNKQGLSAWSQ